MKRNVLLITIDALRYDYLSFVEDESCEADTTPYIDELIRNRSTFFEQHISTGSGTSTAFPGILTSSLPLTHGYGGLNQDHTSLAEVLQQGSVQTLGVTAQTSCSSLYNYDRGFDVFEDWIEEDRLASDSTSLSTRLKNWSREIAKDNPVLAPLCANFYQSLRNFTGRDCPYRQATEVTDTTLSLTENHIDQDEPFFIWVHYMEPHYPYHPPDEFIEIFHNGNWTDEQVNKLIRRLNLTRSDIASGEMIEQVTDEEINVLRDYYMAATRYVDSEIDRLTDGLRELGLLNNTIGFLTADHGEEFFDHGDLGHRPKMYDELVRVPLLCFDNGGETIGNSRVQRMTSHVDLPPTITDLLQVDTPEEWEGHSLLPCITEGETSIRDYIITELCHEGGLGGSVNTEKYIGAVRTENWKYIYNKQLSIEELYDLTIDPEERQNVIKENPKQARELEQKLEARLNDIKERSVDVDISDEAQNRLRELGYIDE